MARALELAATAKGNTFPNPAVGCVIVNSGIVVGEGYHPQAGAPHAEVFALRAAGQLAQGATAYVTLEPCNHYGRTPPCSLALVEAGVARVRLGCLLEYTDMPQLQGYSCPSHLLKMNPVAVQSTARIQVVIGVIDPNPQVGGQGVVRLQKAGVEVDGPCLRDKCYQMNYDFMEGMKADSM